MDGFDIFALLLFILILIVSCIFIYIYIDDIKKLLADFKSKNDVKNVVKSDVKNDTKFLGSFYNTTLAPFDTIRENLSNELRNDSVIIRNLGSSSCLYSPDDITIGFQICDRTNERQMWSYVDYKIIHNKSNKCLEVSEDGLSVSLQEQKNNESQKWSYRNATNLIRNNASNKCLYFDAGVLKVGIFDSSKDVYYRWSANIVNILLTRNDIVYNNVGGTATMKLENNGMLTTRSVSDTNILYQSFSNYIGNKYLIPRDGEVGVAPNYISIESLTGSINSKFVFIPSKGLLALLNQNDVIVWKAVYQYNQEDAPYNVEFQGDKNFVIYNRVKSPVWSSM